MKTIQLEIQNNLFNEFMKWLYSHSENDFNIKYVNEINPSYDTWSKDDLDKIGKVGFNSKSFLEDNEDYTKW